MICNELKIMVPGCRVIAAQVKGDGSCVLKLEHVTAKDIFKLVQASKLSTSDYFMTYTPKTIAERVFKGELEEVIKAGVQDFYRPTLDPSVDSDGQICYKAGMKPAVGKSYNWWTENAKKSGYRLGTRSEYIAFLAVLIKEMVASGKSLEWAWNAVCNDSKELGHYWNSSDAKHTFEATGNREVCGWRDLANTYKIMEQGKESSFFWIAGGGYGYESDFYPLAHLCHYGDRDDDNDCGTGWLVLS